MGANDEKPVWFTTLGGLYEETLDWKNCPRIVVDYGGSSGDSFKAYYRMPSGRWVREAEDYCNFDDESYTTYKEVDPVEVARDIWCCNLEGSHQLPPELEHFRDRADDKGYRQWVREQEDLVQSEPERAMLDKAIRNHPAPTIEMLVSTAISDVASEEDELCEFPDGVPIWINDLRSLAKELRKEGKKGKARPAALAEFMADRDQATFEDVASVVHGDSAVSDGAIQKNATRLQKEIVKKGLAFIITAKNGHVFCEKTPHPIQISHLSAICPQSVGLVSEPLNRLPRSRTTTNRGAIRHAEQSSVSTSA